MQALTQQRTKRRATKPSPMAESFRDLVLVQVRKIAGIDDETPSYAEARVEEILPDNPRLITQQDFNEILSYFGVGAVTTEFWQFFFGTGFQTVEALEAAATKIRTHAMLFHGNFRRGLESLRVVTDRRVFQAPAWNIQPMSERSQMAVDRIVPLSAHEAHATGYLAHDNPLTPQLRGKAKAKAKANAERYMAMDGVHVYVAGSMRSLGDFEMADVFAKTLRQHNNVRQAGLTFFNPLWAFLDNSQQKGLLELLMLKKAATMVYIAGTKESFGKDSELSTMLVQGKPVIAYIPALTTSEEHFQEYEDRYAMFQKHPLAMQCDLNTGVANGVMIARSVDTCGELLWRLFTNNMEFDIDESDADNAFLIERLTRSKVRVVTNNPLLTASFWNQYAQLIDG